MHAVIHNIRAAWAALRSDPLNLARLIVFPSTLIVALEIGKQPVGLIRLLCAVGISIAYCVLAVRVHRHILLTDSERVGAATSHYIGYAAWAMALVLVFALFLFPAAMLGNGSMYPLWYMAFIPAIYFTSRMSLILPNRAVGGTEPIARIWNWSEGNGWKLVAALCLPPLAINALVVLATLGASQEIRQLLKGIASIPVLVFETALLSCAYRDLKTRYL